MEEKKLTDEEVVKALTYCCDGNGHCGHREDCPLRNESACTDILAKYSLDLIHRQKDEIERLTEERDSTIRMNDMYIKYVKKNAELQKQVDELTEKHETNLKTIEELNTRNCALTYNSLERARKTAKDTAKEILQELYEYPHEYHEKKILEIARRKGVEVD